MKRLQSSLITKIALLVICVEVLAFGVLGWFYVDRFSTAADEQLRARLQLVGKLIAEDELQLNAVSRTALMSDLLGADYINGVIVGGNERVIVSTDADHLGRSVRQVSAFDPQWFSETSPDLQYIPDDSTLTCVTRISGRQGQSVYYAILTIDTTTVDAQKRDIAIWGWTASLAFILLTSVGIILLSHRFIGRRVDSTLEVLKKVERGRMDIRIPVPSFDELGELQRGINSMIENIASLLFRHRRNEEELGTILNSVSDGLIAIGRQGEIIRFNANAARLLGAEARIASGQNLLAYLPTIASGERPLWASTLTHGETVDNVRFELPDPYGRQRAIEMGCGPVSDANDTVVGAVLVLRDVTERQAAEDQLRLAANVFTHAREGIIITDAEGTIVDVNRAFTTITGFRREEAIGQNPRILKSDRHGPEIYSEMWRSLVERGYWVGELWNRRKDGESYAEMLTISAVKDVHGITQHYVGLFFDITLQKAQQEQLEYIAHYDALTQLPNRVLLADRLHQSMVQTQRRGQLLAVVYLDLDGFKMVNDQYGHPAGDRLLVAVAQRLREALRKGDTIARLGGDEFVAVLIDLHDTNASLPLLERLRSAVAWPVHVGDLELHVSASLGITFYPQADDVDADQLLRQADQAMYQAKLAGKNRYHVFDSDQDRSVRGFHESLDSIRRALDNNEFVLHYQPQVNMHAGKVIGAEALIRWQHPERGLVFPDGFLTVIEDHPLSVDLGEWVLNTALTQLESWRANGLSIPVSVNVGARQLQQDNFIERLRTLLAAHPGVEPGDLKLEVLETSALNDMAHVSEVMTRCREIGVSFALDDFGTGYSSLTYLKRLPAAELKIDRTFVRDMLEDPDDLAILQGVLSLATAFHREVIAEGVERESQGELLLKLGCERAQGYAIARPMPAEQIATWARNWRPPASWNRQQPAGHDDLPLLFAGVELRAWIRGVEENLDGKSVTQPPLDYRQCPFGVWMAHQGKTRYRTSAGFRDLETLHRRLHAQAIRLLRQQSRGHATTTLRNELHTTEEALLLRLHSLMS